jgi:hypothetical protein
LSYSPAQPTQLLGAVSAATDPAPLAARLVLLDLKPFFNAWLLIALPALLGTYLSSGASTQDVPFMLLGLLQRCAELAALALIALHCGRLVAVKQARVKPSFSRALEVLGVGIGFWLLLLFPFLPESNVPSWLALCLVAAGVCGSYLYYFFVPALLLAEGTFAQRMLAAKSLLIIDWRLPLRVFLPPLALWLLISNLCAAPAPDERYLSLTLLSQLLGSLAWTLGLYLEVAAWLSFSDQVKVLPEAAPARSYNLYSSARGLPSVISQLLSSKLASWLTIAALGLWIANYSRLIEIPPAAEVQIESLEIQESDVLLTLTLRDSEFGFRGVQLSNFILAGEKRVLVSDKPVEVLSINGQAISHPRLAAQPTQQTVVLKFSTARTSSSLRELQDLYLWYRGVKVRLLRFPEEAAPHSEPVIIDSGITASPNI